MVVRVLSVNHCNTRRKNIDFRLVQTWCKPRLDRRVFVAHLVEHRDEKAELATFMLQIVSENLDCFFLARDKVYHPSRSLSLQQRMLPSCAKNLYSQADVYFQLPVTIFLVTFPRITPINETQCSHRNSLRDLTGTFDFLPVAFCIVLAKKYLWIFCVLLIKLHFKRQWCSNINRMMNKM